MTKAIDINQYKRRNYSDAPPEMQTQIREKVHLYVNDEYWGSIANASYSDTLGSVRKDLPSLFNLRCEIEPLTGKMDCYIKMLFPPLVEHLT